MRGADRDGHEQVGTLTAFWNDGLVADTVRPRQLYLHVSFVEHHAGVHQAADIVRVHLIRAHSDGVICYDAADAVALGENDVGYHAPAFAYIQLPGVLSVRSATWGSKFHSSAFP